MRSVEATGGQAKRWWAAGGVALVVAVGLVGCAERGADAGDQEPTDAPAAPATTASPTAAEPSGGPTLKPAEAMRLAQAALLSPDSPLVEDYEQTSEPFSVNLPEFTALFECTGEEVADGRLTSYRQVFEGPWPEIEITAHTYERSSAEVLEQLRETWDSECVTFERTDGSTPYRSERIETVAAPDGVESDHWAADCAEITTLDDGSGGIVFCSALLALGEHVILDVQLSGLLTEWNRYADLLQGIASEVLDSQE